jgi:hypothetical protein
MIVLAVLAGIYAGLILGLLIIIANNTRRI